MLGALCVFGMKPVVFDRARLEAFVAIAQSARGGLLPGAPPTRMPLVPDADVTHVNPPAAWIERSHRAIDERAASAEAPRQRMLHPP